MRCGGVPTEPGREGVVVLERCRVAESISGWFGPFDGTLRGRAGRLAFVAGLMALSALANPD